MRNNRSYKSVRFVAEEETAADLRPWTKRLLGFVTKSLHGIQERHGKLMHIVGPEHRSTRPHRYTVVWSFVAFILFAVLTCVAVRVTTAAMRISYACVSCGLFVVLAELIVADLGFDRRRSYKRNISNTCITALLTVPVMTALYCFMWYPQLNKEVLEYSEDNVASVRFPSVTLLQRSDWASQATLRAGRSKCFIGWFEESAPMCDDVTMESLRYGNSCNCNNSWSPDVGDHLMWQQSYYHYITFSPTSNLVALRPTTTMLLQASFTYNATEALNSLTQKTRPSVYLSIYDPSLNLTEALKINFTTMTLINANSLSSINLDLSYRQKPNGELAYDYSLACDTGQNGSDPCHITLFIQMPKFDRKIIKRRKYIEWLDVASSAGGYYALVQYLSWIISGQAFAA